MARRWVALGVLLFGCADPSPSSEGNPPPRCDAGLRCVAPPDAGSDAPVDSRAPTCPTERGSEPVRLAERLGYPSAVVAPAAIGDPALVTESADEGLRVTVVDVAACATLSSELLPGTPGELVAAGRQLIWMDGQSVRIRDIERDQERALTLQHTALDLHLDAEWLYVLTADPSPAAAGATWLERVARARLTDERVASEPWLRVAFDAPTRLIGGKLTGSSDRLIAGFWSTDLDETAGPAIRIDRQSGAQAVLAPHETSHGMFPLGGRTYQQRAAELLVYEDSQEPAILRRDLENRQLMGVISGHAIVREPSAQLLLALPFDAGAPVPIADEQAPFAGVASSGDDVFWVNWARRLMTVRGVTQ